MNRLALYPGCSLEGTARDYRDSIFRTFELLDIKVFELKDWICCGASSAHSINEEASLELPIHNLLLAESQKFDLLVPCALCFNRLKTADKKVQSNPKLQEKYNYQGNIRIWDIVEFFSKSEIINKIGELKTKPLSALKAVCYYGCVANRPPKVTDAKNYENPSSMERIISETGVNVIDWPFKTDCCGASLALSRPELVVTLVKKLYDKALAFGANCFVVSCQMCHANLDIYQGKISEIHKSEYYLPVFYFTELINLALGDKKQHSWLRRHMVDPTPLLESGSYSPSNEIKSYTTVNTANHSAG